MNRLEAHVHTGSSDVHTLNADNREDLLVCIQRYMQRMDLDEVRVEIVGPKGRQILILERDKSGA